MDAAKGLLGGDAGGIVDAAKGLMGNGGKDAASGALDAAKGKLGDIAGGLFGK